MRGVQYLWTCAGWLRQQLVSAVHGHHYGQVHPGDEENSTSVKSVAVPTSVCLPPGQTPSSLLGVIHSRSIGIVGGGFSAPVE